MTDKEKYIIFCKENENIPLFYQPEWLDVVTNCCWDIVNFLDGEGVIRAYMPVTIKKKWGVKVFSNPVLSPHQGIFFPKNQDFLSEQKKQSFLFKAMNDIIPKIPSFHLFKVRFHPSFDMWLPFYFKGFRQTTYYTYQLHDIKNHEMVFAGFKSNRKNIIRNAKKTIKIEKGSEIETLYRLLLQTFDKKNVKPPFQFEILKKLEETLKDRREILLAKDEKNRVVAGMYLVYDGEQAYNLLFGTDFRYTDSGAPSLLMWEAIKIASERVDTFDFEGSRLPTIQPFFQSFGGKPVPYYEISKTKNIFWQTALLLFNKR